MTEEHGIADRRSSRRVLLKGAAAGAGALWVAPTIDSFVTPAAAASAVTTQTVPLWKDATDPASLCISGYTATATRGSVVYTRSAGAGASISAQITITSGPSPNGANVYILQSNGSTCLQTTSVGAWTGGTGTLTFTGAVVAGATTFTVFIGPLGSGGGTDNYASTAAILP